MMMQDENIINDDEDLDIAGLPDSVELDDEEIPPTDITFECPHCGKGLSIDPRGAGLVITCTQCGQPVTVPIPEGMEIDDLDMSLEELTLNLLRTRQNLVKAEARIAEMEEELDELRTFKKEAEGIDREHKNLDKHLHARLLEIKKLNTETENIMREMLALIIEDESV